MKKGILFCQECDFDVKVKYENEKIISKINGESITIQLEVPYCEKCGKELSDIELEDYRYDLLYKEYRNLKGLLQPNDIKEIRAKYELSQRAFARVLGFAESTINRYELGAIQDNTNNLLIKLADNPNNMMLLLEQNKNNLSVQEQIKLSNKINQLIKDDVDNLSCIERDMKNLIEKFDRHERKLEFMNRKMDIISRKIDNKGEDINKYESYNPSIVKKRTRNNATSSFTYM